MAVERRLKYSLQPKRVRGHATFNGSTGI